MELSADPVDLLSPVLLEDPYPHYARWRESSPVWRSEDLDAWVVTRYADVRVALGDHVRFPQSARFEGALADALGLVPLVSHDPPEHRELRDAFRSSFRPGALESELAPILARRVEELIAGIDPAAPFELAALSKPLAGTAMAALVGSDDPALLTELSRDVLEYLRKSRVGAPDASDRDTGQAAGAELVRYLDTLRGRPAAGPGPGVVSRLPAGEDPATELLVGMWASVLVAGVETSVSGIDTAVHTLLGDPEALAAVRTEPSAARGAFDEALRRTSPIQAFGRTVGEAVEVGGVPLRVGDEVLLFVGSANRDPARYEDPDRFDPARPKRDHLAFGTGAHLCLGAPLIRLEARLLLAGLAAAFPRLRLDEERQAPAYGGGPLLRILDHVWLRAGGPRVATR